MPSNSSFEGDHDDDLPPPGSRWGAGASSVLPYLTKSLQSKPANAAEPREPKQRELSHAMDGGRRAAAA